MADTKQRKAFKGGIGLAVAGVTAWVLGEALDVQMPDMVVAMLGSIIGQIVAWIKEQA